jgi:hypothetical protein
MLPPEPLVPGPVVAPGEFCFAAAGLDHSHIKNMCRCLVEAGAELVWVADGSPLQAEQSAVRLNS